MLDMNFVLSCVVGILIGRGIARRDKLVIVMGVIIMLINFYMIGTR